MDTDEDTDADLRAFADVADVLAGRARLPLDDGASKMLSLLLSHGSTDALITIERFVVHYGPQKRRSPSRYYRRLGPSVVSELLERAALKSVLNPVVLGLPAGELPRTAFSSYQSRLIWIVPAKESVRIIVRPSPEPSQTLFVLPAPDAGPLALRELPAFAPVSTG
jgi:hypothetical protein